MKVLMQTILLSFLLFFGCKIEPSQINFGQDACQSCKMTIVEPLFAAQIVTQKGKAYKFDATECMVRFAEQMGHSKIALYLTSDYKNGTGLIDATKATFLISNQLPSPMGAYLSAYSDSVDAKQLQMLKGGHLYNWAELLDKF